MRCDCCEEEKKLVAVLPYKPIEFADNPQPPIKICLDCLIGAQEKIQEMAIRSALDTMHKMHNMPPLNSKT